MCRTLDRLSAFCRGPQLPAAAQEGILVRLRTWIGELQDYSENYRGVVPCASGVPPPHLRVEQPPPRSAETPKEEEIEGATPKAAGPPPPPPAEPEPPRAIPRRRPSQTRRKHHHLGGAAQKSLKRRGAVHILVEPEKDPGRPEAQGEALLVHGGIWPALCGPAGRGLRAPGRTTGRSCHVERYVLGLPPIARLGRELGEPLLAHGR